MQTKAAFQASQIAVALNANPTHHQNPFDITCLTFNMRWNIDYRVYIGFTSDGFADWCPNKVQPGSEPNSWVSLVIFPHRCLVTRFWTIFQKLNLFDIFSFSTGFSFLSGPNIFQQVPLVRIQRPAICLAPRQNRQHMLRLNNFDHNRYTRPVLYTVYGTFFSSKQSAGLCNVYMCNQSKKLAFL